MKAGDRMKPGQHVKHGERVTGAEPGPTPRRDVRVTENEENA